MSRVIGVLSGKGGVGKTMLVANLGAVLTNTFNKNVLIFDTNIHTSHLGLHLGIYEDLPVTLREVLKRKISILNAVYLHPATGIRIIPAPLSGDGVNLTKDKCRKLVNGVKNNYDMVLLDCSPGLGNEVITAVHSIDDAIIVTTPELPAITDALKTIDLLKKLDKGILGIVVNRYRNEKYELTPNEIMSTAKVDVIGMIPEDKRVPESISKGVPVVLSYPNSSASDALKSLAGRLIGVPYVRIGILEAIKRLFGFSASMPNRIPNPTKLTEERMVPEKSEVKDVRKLKEELTKEVRNEIKNELAERVKKRLKERMG